MKAVYLQATNKPLLVKDVPEPRLRAGGAIVQVKSAPVLSYMRQVVTGKLGYSMPLPFIPGNAGIGEVVEVADDVFDFKPGQLVFMDPYVGSRTNGGEYDDILIGLTGLSAVSGRMFDLWHDGTFAERALVPAETLTVFDEAKSLGAERLAALTRLAIPYGGLLKTGLRAGKTIMIGGATGNIGAGAVMVALAMGASRVIALGRDSKGLAELEALDSRRVVAVALEGGDVEALTARIKAAGGPIDTYFDMTGAAPDPTPIMAAIGALRRGGTAVFMGGVQATLPIPYSQIMFNELTLRGNFMYPREAPGDLLQMVLAGTLDLSKIKIKSFRLDQIEEAIDDASAGKGLNMTVVKP
ncbi:Alcohol dehydrogenase, zinc-binding [Acidisarcina polymorpha]|uniref:Alcohol dehydrogenase, zinc-binding n=1 Tax=Acidisarcina polymorpha TaxID=2211140 RepID=A0A2Z5G886_9BACT|nr:zinc-binding dehydrogenase [Acidisarcina polymorpha]AXC15200.1 Alcohol dehydrogenase, zinc-binding [Acidisarcina polymorpha]